MSAKVILVLCAQALFIQTAFSSCLGHGAIATPGLLAPGCAGTGWAGNGLIGSGNAGNWANNGLIGTGCAGLEIIPTSGGGLPVSSISAIAPSGLSVASDNVYEGALCVNGELPFVGAVALEGVLPSGGAGGVSYSCGDGITAIESIAPSATGYGAAGAYGAGGPYGVAGPYGTAGAYGLGAGTAALAPATLGLGYVGRECGCGVY